MPDSPILGIPQVTANQAAKEVTINDGFSIVERSLNAVMPVSMVAGDVELGLTDYQRHGIFHCSGHAVPRVLTVPPSPRSIVVINDGSGGGVITVDGGGVTQTVPIGSRVWLINNGVDLFKMSDSAVAGGVDSFLDLPDTPNDYTGQALKYVRVNAAENGLEFAAVAGGGSSIVVVDESTELTAAATKLTFAGAGVTASEPVANEVLITIPGAAGSALIVVDESTELTAAALKLTFAGDGVTATEPVANEILITIPGGGGGGAGNTLTMFAGGTFLTNELLMQVIPATAWTLPAGLTGSKFLLGSVTTASTQFELKKNGASIGTITFAAASGTSPTVVFSGAVAFDGVDDILTLHAPASVDATAGNLSMSLVGS